MDFMSMETKTKIKEIVTITNSAKNRIVELVSNSNNPNIKLRIYINGGGCSGFEYCFAFEEQLEDDILIQDGDAGIIIDPVSLGYLQGSSLDYIKTLTEASFVINNPNAKATCDCGASFCC